jgi:hypothetical protein
MVLEAMELGVVLMEARLDREP